MKAALAIGGFGAPRTRHDLPARQPGEGEVLVRVRASAVNGFGVAVAGGSGKGMTGQRPYALADVPVPWLISRPAPARSWPSA